MTRLELLDCNLNVFACQRLGAAIGTNRFLSSIILGRKRSKAHRRTLTYTHAYTHIDTHTLTQAHTYTRLHAHTDTRLHNTQAHANTYEKRIAMKLKAIMALDVRHRLWLSSLLDDGTSWESWMQLP